MAKSQLPASASIQELLRTRIREHGLERTAAQLQMAAATVARAASGAALHRVTRSALDAAVAALKEVGSGS